MLRCSILIRLVVFGLTILVFADRLMAAGLYLDAEARSGALGGEAVAAEDSVLAAMDSNAAALASLESPAAAVTLTGAILNGKFAQPGRNSSLRDGSGVLAAGALELPAPRQWPIRFGLAVVPNLILDSSWQYLDRPGGLGGTTSYGQQTHHSQLISIRNTAAAAFEVNHWLSLGASAGFVYHQNSLHAPYIFQSQPVLRGFKTLLDLETDGVAPTFDFGVQVRPTDKLTLGLSYRPRTVISTTGTASGNARAQLLALGGGFALARPDFHYEAEVRTELPQQIALGGEWQFCDRVRAVAGIDWVNWGDAFDQLQIHLKNGSNADINGVVGADYLTDIAPLRWRDQFVYRVGFEVALTENLTARVGYSYARSPVPNDTLTPPTAAIFEHTVSVGAGYRWGRYHADLAWQWRLPATQHVGTSLLSAGEYSDTSVTVSAHLLQFSTGLSF